MGMARHLHRAIKEHVDYFNRARPHQGIGQRVSGGTVSLPAWPRRGRLIRVPSSTDRTTTTVVLCEPGFPRKDPRRSTASTE